MVGIGGFIGQAALFLWGIRPVFSDWPLVLVPMVSALAVAVGLARLVGCWSRARDWNDLHRVALASGAVICHTLIGVLAVAQTPADRIVLIALGLAMSGALI